MTTVPAVPTMPEPAKNRSTTPSILFLHGAGAWGGQWAIWRRMFEAEGWQVDAPDLQPVAAGVAATRFEDYVVQASAMIIADRHDVLVGASLGGLIARAALVRTSPVHRPRSLVLVNPLPTVPWVAALPAFDPADDPVVPWHSQGRFASTRRALPDGGFADQQRAFRHWRDESSTVLREAHAGIVLPECGIPTLVIASDADETIPAAVSAAYAAGIGASLCRVPGGHIAPVMGASAVVAARSTLAWLATSRC